jgi:hypothetical protein
MSEIAAARAGWDEALVAWSTCAALHNEYCKTTDPLFKTRHDILIKNIDLIRDKLKELQRE